MNRIEERLQYLKDKKQKAFITYMTAGLPDMESTKNIIRAQEKAGTDIIELGVPFSDPIADGPIIQDASYRSIQNGTNVKKIFQMVKEVRKDCKIPIIFMMYFNTIHFYGLEAFVEKCIEVGVDGLIIPDLPFEEQEQLTKYMNDENAPILIQLVSPVSGNRIQKILKHARGFVYCVSSMGVTGQAGTFHKDVIHYLEEVKAESKVPVMMGFGIREANDIAPMKDIIDGAIVGSHFIQVMEEGSYDTVVITQYCKTFKEELNRL